MKIRAKRKLARPGGVEGCACQFAQPHEGHNCGGETDAEGNRDSSKGDGGPPQKSLCSFPR